MIYYIYAGIAFLLDQVSKWIIVQRMQVNDSYSVIGEFFNITSHRNKGAAFGILQNQRWFFVIITVFVVIGIVWYMQRLIKQGKRFMPFALSLLLGGALGNFIDRALFGEVVDFLDFRFKFNFLGNLVDYGFPIFNLADSAIVIGVALIFADSFREWRHEKLQLKGEQGKLPKSDESGEFNG